MNSRDLEFEVSGCFLKLLFFLLNVILAQAFFLKKQQTAMAEAQQLDVPAHTVVSALLPSLTTKTCISPGVFSDMESVSQSTVGAHRLAY